MSIWSERTCWARTAWLDVEAVAEVTGLKPDTIYHYVSRKDPKFPQPNAERGRNYFAADQVFSYVLAHQPKRHDRIPRLYPRIPEPAPAQFLSATRVRLPDVGTFAVHAWQPADGAPPIAIAYPDRKNTMNIHTVEKSAATLLDYLPPHIKMVAVPNGETSSCAGPNGGSQNSPTILVVERNPVYRHDPVSHGASRYRWPELANLLRVDIPWWSALLNDLDAMLNWQPGTPPARITPYAPSLDTGHITALARPDDSAEVHQALGKLAHRILRLINGETADDRNRLTPGLIQAATSTIDTTEPEPELTAAEAATILHHRTDEHTASHALRVVDSWAFVPLLTHTIRLVPTASAMAREWTSRLTDVAADRRTELGFWFVNNSFGTSVRPVRWATDPAREHSWVIEGDNGIVYAGVGTSTPDARGTLIEAEIADDAAFFRDTTGHVWPLPDTCFDYYNTGYEGGGPQRLAETLTTLLRAASSDVGEPPNLRNPINDARYQALYALVTTKHAPLTITADWVKDQHESRRLL
jgi:hypothetical protein